METQVIKTEREQLSEQVASIKVIPLDMEKLNLSITGAVIASLNGTNPNSTYEVHGKQAILKMNGKTILLEHDCVGEIIDDDKVAFDVYEHFEEGGWSMTPKASMTTKLSEVEAEFGLPEVSLESFMGDRFGYNTRVKSNIEIIAKEVGIRIKIVR
jgi:hypothetical protein